MAVTAVNGWTAVAGASDPTGSPTISALTNGLVVLVQILENSSGITVSTMTMGGQSATGSDTIFWESGDTGDGTINVWWWDQSAVDLFSGTSISYTDDAVLTKRVFSVASFSGVDQTTPVSTASASSETAATSYDISSSSTAQDIDIVAIYRSSANRDIEAYDTLTEGFQWNTDMTAAVASGAGGDSTISITIDDIPFDLTHMHLILNAAAAGTGLTADGGANRGILRGVLRGVG